MTESTDNDNRAEPLADDDVVSAASNLMGTPTFRVSQIREHIEGNLGYLWSAPIRQCLGGGANCEILKAGQGWRKGKFRIRAEINFEFIPDEEAYD